MEAALRDAGAVRHYAELLYPGRILSLDGEKKYAVGIGMLSEGMTLKTEAGKTIGGPEQSSFLSASPHARPNIESLVGKHGDVLTKTQTRVKNPEAPVVGSRPRDS